MVDSFASSWEKCLQFFITTSPNDAMRSVPAAFLGLETPRFYKRTYAYISIKRGKKVPISGDNVQIKTIRGLRNISFSYFCNISFMPPRNRLPKCLISIDCLIWCKNWKRRMPLFPWRFGPWSLFLLNWAEWWPPMSYFLEDQPAPVSLRSLRAVTFDSWQINQ